MSSQARYRWLCYGVALLATLAAVRWVNGFDDAQAKAPVASASAEAPVVEALASGLPQRPYSGPRQDPFGSRSWQQLEAEETARNMPAAPPPEPEAPPLPFRYMGRLIEGERTTVFLTIGQTNYIARTGDVLSGSYRVKHIGEDRMTLIYLPLGTAQQLVYASASSAGSASMPRRSNDEEEADAEGQEEQ